MTVRPYFIGINTAVVRGHLYPLAMTALTEDASGLTCSVTASRFLAEIERRSRWSPDPDVEVWAKLMCDELATRAGGITSETVDNTQLISNRIFGWIDRDVQEFRQSLEEPDPVVVIEYWTPTANDNVSLDILESTARGLSFTSSEIPRVYSAHYEVMLRNRDRASEVEHHFRKYTPAYAETSEGLALESLSTYRLVTK